MIETVIEKCNQLKLSSFATHLEPTLKTGEQANWGMLKTIEHLLDLEMERREQNRVNLRFRQSFLEEISTIDQFDFNYHVSRKKQKNTILNLLTKNHSKQILDIILIGNPGTGKTMLAKCIGYQATQNGTKVLFTTAMELINQLIAADANRTLLKKLHSYQTPDLLIIDEIGYLPLGSEGSNLFFQIISARHQKKSTLITTNLLFADWGRVFDNTTVATAIVDRLVYGAQILMLEGESYRKTRKLKQ